MRNRLLVVDGEPRSLRVLDVSLRGAGFDVETAGDGLQAWALLENATPDLIICDAELAGIDGFELCARVRRSEAGAQLPVLLLSASRSREQKIRALEAGADDFLAKPAYINEIVTRVRALLQRRDRDALALDDGAVRVEAPPGGSGRVASTPFAGDLAAISVVDLVQLIENNGRSGIVHLRGPSGSPAFVYFRGGKVIDAEAGRLSGLDALSRLFSWTTGTFEIEWKNIRRKDVIDQPPAELVLDGMQRLDAWNELRGQLADPRAVFEVDYRLLAERLAEIPDEVNGILRLCDGVRTVLQVVEDSSMSDTEALTALLRLHAEGIVYDKAAPASEEAHASSARLDGWLGAGSSPFATAGSGPNRRSGVGSGPVEQSLAERLEVEAESPAPAPEPPRRTAPGLGQPVAPAEAELADAIPERRDERSERGAQQNNVIQFPGQPVTAEPAPAVRNNPTQVGFEPLMTAAEPAPEVPPPAPVVPEPNPMSMTLPLGRAQEAAALARDRLLREQSAPVAVPPPVAADAAAPAAPASMTDTHRGFGPIPPSSTREPSPALGVPVEIPESTSGAARSSDRVSAPAGAVSGAVAEQPAKSGRIRVPTAENAVVSGAVAIEPSTRQANAREASGGQVVPRPGDATVKVSFPDHDISKRDALDELGLPSRWRSIRVLVGALVVGALAAVGVNRFLGTRATHDEAAPAAAVPAAEEHAGAAPAPAGAVVVPVAEHAAPAVELPTPAAAPAHAETHEPAKPAVEATEVAPLPVPAPKAAVKAVEAPAAKPAAKLVEEVAAKPAEKPAPKPPAAGGRELTDCRTAFARNRLKEALAACGAAVASNPGSADALTMLAHTELNRGRLARANELAQKAVGLDPNQADAYVIIGGVHQDSGQNREAKAAYRRYLELAPRGRYADELRSIVNGL